MRGEERRGEERKGKERKGEALQSLCADKLKEHTTCVLESSTGS